jgi:hypothetical protein
MFRPASPLSVKVGISLAIFHVAIVLAIVWSLLASELDAQWQLTWVPLLLLDFPVSLVVVFSTDVFAGMSSPWTSFPASELHGFVLPALVHGILGSLWWFILPVAVSSAWNSIRARSQQKE